MATLNVEAGIFVEASQVAEDVLLESGLLLLRLHLHQVLQPVAGQHLVVRRLIVLRDWVDGNQRTITFRAQHLVGLEVQHSGFEMLAGNERGAFEPGHHDFNAKTKCRQKH